MRFEGLRVSRVYPAVLPNVPIGMQQIVVGRFQPNGEEVTGQIVVEGQLAGKTVHYTRGVAFGATGTGNSFLPRLWARRHVDALLEQGASAAIQEQIVAFSEEYGILTPYTSLLVLENDEERARYGVTRRVKIRDGEAFFAEGQDEARTETLRTAMRDARSWRLLLREQALREIAALGRDLYSWTTTRGIALGGLASLGRAKAGLTAGIPLAGGGGDRSRYRESGAWGPSSPGPVTTTRAGYDAESFDTATALPSSELPELDDLAYLPRQQNEQGEFGPADKMVFERNVEFGRRALRSRVRPAAPSIATPWAPPAPAPGDFATFGFPSLGQAIDEQAPERPASAEWSKSVVSLLKSLDRRDRLVAARLALDVERTTTNLDEHDGAVLDEAHAAMVFAPGQWLLRTQSSRAGQPLLQWVADGKRSIVALGLGLGRTRPASAKESNEPPAGFGDFTATDLIERYRGWQITSSPSEKGIATLTLTAPRPSRRVELLAIDTTRRVPVRHEVRDGARTLSTTTWSDFVQIGDEWFAQQAVVRGTEGGDQRHIAQKFTQLDDDALAKRMQSGTADGDGAVMVPAEDPKLDAAREAVHSGHGTFADWFRVCVVADATGRHDRALDLWKTAAALIEGRRGAQWLELQLISRSRRGEQRLDALGRMADALATQTDAATVFRAEMLMNVLANGLGAHELLALHDRVAGAYRAAGDAAVRLWNRREAGLLENAGETERSLALREQLVEARPGDVTAQIELANARRGAGRNDAAIAGLRAALDLKDTFGQQERDALWSRLVDVLWGTAQLDDAQAAFDAWTGEPAHSQEAWLGRWSVLLYRGKVEDADGAALAAATTGDLDLRNRPEDVARISAATSYLLGSGWNWSTGVLLPELVPSVDALCRRLLAADGGAGRAIAILNGAFGGTDAGKALGAELVKGLVDGDAVTALATEALLAQLGAVRPKQLDDDAWAKLANALAARATREPDDWGRTSVWRSLIGLCDARGDRARAIDVLRAWLANDSAADTHPEAASLLVHRLADSDWSDGLADEMFALIPQAADPWATPSARRSTLAGASRFVADALASRRVAALLGPTDELEKLERRERREREKAAEQQMQSELALRFASAADAAPPELAPWLRIEALCFAVEAGDSRDDVLARTRTLLDAVVDLPADAELPRDLRERCSLVVAHAATDRGADPAFVDAVLSLYDTRAKAHADLLDWRGQTLRLLAALDRPADMLSAIDSWLDPKRLDVRLRIARAKLLAEVGKVDDAIAEAERVRAAAELDPGDLEALANWYLVAGDDGKRADAIAARFAAMTRWQLQNLAVQEMNRVSRRGSGVPDDLNPTVLVALRTWVTELDDPTDAEWVVRSIYDSTKDYRVLAAFGYGVTGHAPEQVYRLLQRIENVLDHVHEEATLDALKNVLDQRAEDATTNTDHRALAIAELLVARRGMNVTHGADTYRPAAMHALDLVEASVREHGVVPGEVVPLADLLADLGSLPDAALHERRIAILTDLVDLAAKGSAVQLEVARARARAMWAQGDQANAIDALAEALRVRATANGGVLPKDALTAASQLVGWWNSPGHYRDAESWLFAERDAQPDADGRRPFEDRLDDVYVQCLSGGGSVSLGSGDDLFTAAKARLLGRLDAEPPWVRPGLASSYCALHRAANKAGVGRPLESLRRFAVGPLPGLLDGLPTLHQGVLYTVADTLADLGGPIDALRLTVSRCTTEPAWHARVGQDVWNQLAWSMAEWRSKCGSRLDDVEAPLRQLVLDHFESYLVDRSGNGEGFWTRSNERYWAALTDDYLTVARRVLELHAESTAICSYTANVMWSQLQRHSAAIDAMLALDARHPLDPANRLQLVRWLQSEKRWADSLPHAETVANAWPSNLEAQLVYVRALGATGHGDQARAAIATAEKRLDDAKALNPQALSQLAGAAVVAKLDDVAAPLYERAIRGRERTNPSGADWWIAQWYGEWAKVLAGLGRTDEAVDAASAAIVRWDSRQDQRKQAITDLETVLASIPDLNAWIRSYDAQVAKTGLDAPVLRRALGAVLVRTRDFEGALAQYRAARDLEPNDLGTWQQIVAMLDALGRPADACDALLGAIEANPRELQLIAELARRYDRIGDEAQAERARTDLVEPLPHEPEGHRTLAQLRERAKDFGAAVTQWRQVVRTDREDAEGWLSLAQAELKAGDRDAAQKTVDEILKRSWDARFENVKAKAAKLLD